MIFVSVGTHEQGFDRLLREIDSIKGNMQVEDGIFVQSGYSTFMVKNCAHVRLLSYEEMRSAVRNARIYITHGGPGNIFLGFEYRKVPIVVPRMSIYGEHVDNHQVAFVKRLEFEKRILAVYKIECLWDAIRNYDSLIKGCKFSNSSNEPQRMLIEKLNDFCSILSGAQHS